MPAPKFSKFPSARGSGIGSISGRGLLKGGILDCQRTTATAGSGQFLELNVENAKMGIVSESAPIDRDSWLRIARQNRRGLWNGRADPCFLRCAAGENEHGPLGIIPIAIGIEPALNRSELAGQKRRALPELKRFEKAFDFAVKALGILSAFNEGDTIRLGPPASRAGPLSAVTPVFFDNRRGNQSCHRILESLTELTSVVGDQKVRRAELPRAFLNEPPHVFAVVRRRHIY